MVDLTLIPRSEFQRVLKAEVGRYEKLALIADMCRANTLMAIKKAGSGHLGSSLSAMDIVVWLYYAEMNTMSLGLDSVDRDIYFSSKGHDVPGLYSVLFSLGVLPEEKLLRLRRLGGLEGHPDVRVRGIEANSGSLGMGISKAKGMAWAKEKLGYSGRVFVMTGDGELEEGQCYEALQTAVHQRVKRLTVIVDHNKVQTDRQVSKIVDLGDLDEKIRAFGWHVVRCDGHDFRQLDRVFHDLRSVTQKPKALIADTIKGRGVSFMEHPTVLAAKELYPWHAGAPDDEHFRAAYRELVGRANFRLKALGLAELELKEIPADESQARAVTVTPRATGQPAARVPTHTLTPMSKEYVADAFGEALLEISATRPDLVVLDADLASDCRIRHFEETYPERFIENGIAEQDMVSMAGGLARQGLLPVVNSFASFLASRANEQIYNNACENTKIIYACHYAGLIPAGPGKSHQSIRDISLLGALPNCVILQPCNSSETRMAVEYCVNEAAENCVIRLAIGPSPRIIRLPEDYRLTRGKGVVLNDGSDAVLFAYGPVMLHEALLASEILFEQKWGLRVVNLPWLNRVDSEWLANVTSEYQRVFVLEDHAPVGGIGDMLQNALAGLNRPVIKFAIEGFPACGAPAEVLRYHRLDGQSLVERILHETMRQ